MDFQEVVTVLFITSCTGLGFLAGRRVLNRDRSRWLLVVFVPLIAALWPFAIGLFVIVTGSRWAAQHPQDHAPAMVWISFVTVVAPSIFFLGTLLAIIGIIIAYFITDGKDVRPESIGKSDSKSAADGGGPPHDF